MLAVTGIVSIFTAVSVPFMFLGNNPGFEALAYLGSYANAGVNAILWLPYVIAWIMLASGSEKGAWFCTFWGQITMWGPYFIYWVPPFMVIMNGMVYLIGYGMAKSISVMYLGFFQLGMAIFATYMQCTHLEGLLEWYADLKAE